VRRLAPAIIAFASFLSAPAGFVAVMTTVAIGFGATSWYAFSDIALTAFNLYLSVLAIVIGSSILVAGDRDTRAIHVKLDELIIASDAKNRAVGIERRSVEEIEAERKRAETECDEDRSA
jgi:low affinity Fe/Cu permease